MLEQLWRPDALWFSVPAVVGSSVFLVRILLMTLGGDSHGGGSGDVGLDTDLDTDVTIDGETGLPDHGTDHAFTILSVQGAAAFLMGFGWGGVGARLGSGWSMGASALFGVGAGLAMAWLLAWLLNLALQLQSSGTLSPATALGATGDVYLTVPEQGAGSGQVRVVIGNRMRIYTAVSQGDALPTQARIRVVAVNDDNTLTVTAA